MAFFICFKGVKFCNGFFPPWAGERKCRTLNDCHAVPTPALYVRAPVTR